MGNKLFAEIMELTGLPEEVIGKELKSVLAARGVEPKDLTMDSLREALAEYLRQVSQQLENESEGEFHSEVKVSDSNFKAPTQ